MGIRFYCSNGHKLNVKEFQGGKKGICPFCGVKIRIPTESTRKSSKEGAADEQDEQRVTEIAEADNPPAESAFTAASDDLSVPGRSPLPEPPMAPFVPATAAQAVPPAYPSAGVVSAPAGPGGAIPGAPISGPRARSAVTEAVPSAARPTTAPIDPLAESSSSVWYVRPLSGGQFGPATAEIMRSWISEGRVSSDSMVWREGWPDWVGAVTVFPQLGSSPVAPGQATKQADTSELATIGGKPSPGISHPYRRSKSNTTQVAVITALVMAVMVLFAIFLWVVNY
jgi:hypothetical protein